MPTPVASVNSNKPTVEPCFWTRSVTPLRHAGQVAPCSSGIRGRPPGWQQADSNQCAYHWYHQPKLERNGQKRGVPRGSLLPNQRLSSVGDCPPSGKGCRTFPVSVLSSWSELAIASISLFRAQPGRVEQASEMGISRKYSGIEQCPGAQRDSGSGRDDSPGAHSVGCRESQDNQSPRNQSDRLRDDAQRIGYETRFFEPLKAVQRKQNAHLGAIRNQYSYPPKPPSGIPG